MSVLLRHSLAWLSRDLSVPLDDLPRSLPPAVWLLMAGIVVMAVIWLGGNGQ